MSSTPNADAATAFITGTADRRLPDAVLNAARMCLVDWFGVAIGARDEGAAQVVGQVGQSWGHTGGAQVLFGAKADPATAALINGTMAHCLDFDDTHVGSLAHLSGPTWAATLAVGAALNSQPADMLQAFVTGFEIGARIGGGGFGEALNTRTLHSTGFCGCFAAAAAASVLLRLDTAQVGNALGAAATQAAGLTGSFGTMSKPFHAGKAALNGVLAAQLANAGFTAADNLIEAENGLATALIQDGSQTISAMTFAAGDWEILRNTFKPYASCLLTHPVIDSARKLLPQIRERAIKAVTINVHPMAVQLAGKSNPQSPLEGKFSTAYCAALALSGHVVAATDFSADRLHTPRLRDLITRVNLIATPEMEKTAASMTVTLTDGSLLKADTPLALGNPGNPMQWEDMEQKFIGLVEPVLGRRAAPTYLCLRRFEASGDLDNVFAALAASCAEAKELITH
ncbi:MAG: MmgE/PrpD family protein [Pseudolabrys sp.]|nr:MmgE/PrpD family protein [Pseudolabrys sp.]MDP2297001.1 MmgE/PrpD family protein [Pseudolabrys sp.]